MRTHRKPSLQHVVQGWPRRMTCHPDVCSRDEPSRQRVKSTPRRTWRKHLSSLVLHSRHIKMKLIHEHPVEFILTCCVLQDVHHLRQSNHHTSTSVQSEQGTCAAICRVPTEEMKVSTAAPLSKSSGRPIHRKSQTAERRAAHLLQEQADSD